MHLSERQSWYKLDAEEFRCTTLRLPITVYTSWAYTEGSLSLFQIAPLALSVSKQQGVRRSNHHIAWTASSPRSPDYSSGLLSTVVGPQAQAENERRLPHAQPLWLDRNASRFLTEAICKLASKQIKILSCITRHANQLLEIEVLLE